MKNLTMRMHNRRYERVLQESREPRAYGRDLRRLNFIRIHKTLRVTPAMAAGLSQAVMDWLDIIALIDADAAEALRARRAAMLDLTYSN